VCSILFIKLAPHRSAQITSCRRPLKTNHGPPGTQIKPLASAYCEATSRLWEERRNRASGEMARAPGPESTWDKLCHAGRDCSSWKRCADEVANSSHPSALENCSLALTEARTSLLALRAAATGLKFLKRRAACCSCR
jgi:hypothetical protein